MPATTNSRTTCRKLAQKKFSGPPLFHSRKRCVRGGVELLVSRRKRNDRAGSRARSLATSTATKTTMPQQSTNPAPNLKLLRGRIQLRRTRRRAAAVFSGIVALVGLLGVYVLRPDISIEPYATIDPTHPFQQQFFVQNLSVYSIHDVEPFCGFDSDTNFIAHNLSLHNPAEDTETLEPNAKTTLTCSLLTGPIGHQVNIVPWAKYKVSFRNQPMQGDQV